MSTNDGFTAFAVGFLVFTNALGCMSTIEMTEHPIKEVRVCEKSCKEQGLRMESVRFGATPDCECK